MVSADTVKRFLNDFYQTTSGTDYCSIRLFCFKKNRYGSLVPDHDLENVTLATYVAACLELNPSMNVRDGRGLKSNSVVHFHTGLRSVWFLPLPAWIAAFNVADSGIVYGFFINGILKTSVCIAHDPFRHLDRNFFK